MTTPNTQSEALLEAQAALEKLTDCDSVDEFAAHYQIVHSYLSKPPAPEQASGERGITKINPGFRWDANALHHVPQLLIEFTPVPANSPSDAKGWVERDALANLLAATPTAEPAGEAVRLPLDVEFAASYLDGVIEGEHEEIRSKWAKIRRHLSHPPEPEQASGELVASADCPLCGKDTPHGHGTEDIAEWLRIQARRFVGANADDLIRINTSEVHLIDSLRRQIQELEHRVESLTPETSYENYGKSDAELKALFATTKEEATHNGIEFLMHGKNMAFKIGNQMFAMAYEPDEPGDFEFMKGALLHALSTITPNVKVTFLAKLDQANTKDAIAQVVDRFLGWKLPKDFGPDAGISFTPPPNPEWWPTGTNLFTAVQTKQMLEYLLSASPAAPEAAKPADDEDEPAPSGDMTKYAEFWERLPGHLIDHHEGEELTEEMLQRAAADLWAKFPDLVASGLKPFGLLLLEERATTSRLVRALREATEAPTFIGEPVKAAKPEPQAQVWPHRWDDSGERCIKCGDKDWMGGPCSVPSEPLPPAQPKEQQAHAGEPEVTELDCGCKHCGMSLSKIAKKDAALLACVEALEWMLPYAERYGVDKNVRAAITKAKGAL